ncbi:carbohydrate ABC transporter permease [Symbioplanes lichenis]|uniref:carbohydrate ABC transporter permease n=1 Tax=Symbioplanes lichenis TaxID=1629072 RepID=UPI0027391ADD|nr:sugar ABC transporter permease [Actinoplanes lichenis]
MLAARPGRRDLPSRLMATGTRSRGPLLLILPSIIFMAALFLYPLLSGIWQAFSGPDGFTTAWFSRMADDPYFWEATRNTALLIVVLIPLQFGLAILMALLLRQRPRLAGLHFYIWVVPLAISDLAAGLVWLSVFTDRGYLNSVLDHLGLGSYAWLSFEHPGTMFLAVVLAELWRATSLVFVIVVAGLQGVPRDYDEAAEVFGASYWQRVWHVLLPQLRPSLQVALILRTILALEAFAVAQALTGRNFPLLVGETYQWYYTLQNPNVATAIALVVLALSILAAIGYLRLMRRTPEVG